MTDILLTPTQLGDIHLNNRVIMAPMTRSRAGVGDAPTELNALYYAQRVGAGMIVTEGVQPSDQGKGYSRTPGIYSDEQIQGWKGVRKAVTQASIEEGHSQPTSMVMQIMHCGRVGSSLNKLSNGNIVAPSRIAAKGEIYTDTQGMVPFETPHELTITEIAAVIEDYRQAAENAFNCGLDGVELHGTSGYLPSQFLSTGSNHRTDKYGGSVTNRLRFVIEVLEAMASVKGSGRVGIRICPGNPFNGIKDDNPLETYTALLNEITHLDLAYLHVIRMPTGPVDNIALAQNAYQGNVILNDSYGSKEARETISSGMAQAISFARGFVSNPNFVHKLVNGLPLTAMNNSTLYIPGEQGYTDYV